MGILQDIMGIQPKAYHLVISVRDENDRWRMHRFNYYAKRKIKDKEIAEELAKRLKRELKISGFKIRVSVEGIY